MKIVLGIESSCDDTGVALVNSNREILSNVVISQNTEHEIFQGVVPEIAARSHMQNLTKAVAIALTEAKLSLADGAEAIDAIAATSGPGLIGGVIVGSMFARSLASVLKKPFIAINHLEGHALTARLTDNISYPYLLLLASGGHCQFVAVRGLGKYKILGQTLDDAAGEAFDKVGKMLGLPFPGGPEIERRAKLGDEQKYELPKPLINKPDCDMSFSGLKTAVRLLIAAIKETKVSQELSEQDINDVAASFQYTVAKVLSIKLSQAIKTYNQLFNEEVSTIVIAGGVAANQYLKSTLAVVAEQHKATLVVPPIKLCTDNAAMIAYAGMERLKAGLTSDLSFCPRARWSLEDL